MDEAWHDIFCSSTGCILTAQYFRDSHGPDTSNGQPDLGCSRLFYKSLVTLLPSSEMRDYLELVRKRIDFSERLDNQLGYYFGHATLG